MVDLKKIIQGLKTLEKVDATPSTRKLKIKSIIKGLDSLTNK